MAIPPTISPPTDPLAPATEAPDAFVRVRLQRAPLWSGGLTLLLLVTCGFAASAAMSIVPALWRGEAVDSGANFSVALVIICLGFITASLGKRWFVRRRPMAPVTFYDHAMQIPEGPESLRSKRVPYEEILSVNEGGRPPNRVLFIESRRQVFMLPQSIFCDADGAERLILELRRRIMALPQGTSLLERTERYRQSAALALTQRPFWTHAVVGVIAVFLANTYFKGSMDSALGLLRWGANVPTWVHQGQWFRVVSALFLHTSVWHGAMCGVTILSLGYLLERLLGWERFILLFLGSGVVGTAAGALTRSTFMSVGASPAIFGLLAGFAVLSWRLRLALPIGLRQPLRWWIFMLGINLMLPAFWPLADFTALAASFAFGGIFTWLTLGNPARLPAQASVLWQRSAYASMAVTALALGFAIFHAVVDPADVEMHLARDLLRHRVTSAPLLDDMARTWSSVGHATPAEMRCAAQLADAACDESPQDPWYHDTAAQVALRLGDRRGAVAQARIAVDHSDDPRLTSRMGQFLSLYMEKSGPWLDDSVQAASVHIAVDKQSGELTLQPLPNTEQAWDVYALVRRGDTTGVVHAAVGKSVTTNSHFTPLRLPWIPKVDHVEIALVAPSRAPAPDGIVQWFEGQW